MTILYKYRALEPWEFFLDILVHSRLYAAKFTTLNDPMEGVFSYSQDSASPSFVEQMINFNAQLGICSLSSSYNNTLMWSYYGSSHQGVVFGVEVPEEGADIIAIECVTYEPDNIFKGFLGSDFETEARKVLSKKLSAWKHEAEVRVFSRSSFVPVQLKSIYLGCLMPSTRKYLVRQLVEKINPKIEVIELKRDDLDRRIGTGVV